MGRVTQIIASLTACLSVLVYGTMFHLAASVTSVFRNNEPINATTATVINDQTPSPSLYVISLFVGALAAGTIIDYLGKRKTMVILSVPWVFCWLVILVGNSVYYLHVVRFIQGVVMGILSICVPTYIGEITEPSIRGTLSTFYKLFFTIGICAEYMLIKTNTYFLTASVGYLLEATTSYLALASICIIISIAYICGTPFLPESPTDLLRNGKEKHAMHVLRRLRDNNDDEGEEIEETKRNLETTNGKANCRALITGISVQLGQELCGIDALNSNGILIFSAIKSSFMLHHAFAITSVVQIIALCVSAKLIDRVGRKPLLVCSSFAMGLCLIALGAVLYLAERSDGKASGWFLELITAFCFVTCYAMFSIGFGPVPYVMIGELFAPKIKHFACSISVASNFLLIFVAMEWRTTIGRNFTLWIHAAFCFFLSNWVAYYFVETKVNVLHIIIAQSPLALMTFLLHRMNEISSEEK